MSFDSVTDGTHTLSGTIGEVRLGTTALTQGTDYTIAEGKIRFKKSALQTAGTGLKQVKVITEQSSELCAYTFDMLLCSKIITTAEQFKNMKTYYTKKGTAYVGYVLLGDDIDLNNWQVANNDRLFEGNWNGSEDGLGGTFDGGGHTVKNFGVATFGLFGAIVDGGVIKNVSFINVTGMAGDCGIIAQFNHGTLMDIFVSASLTQKGDGNGPGVLAHSVYNTTKFTRCVVQMLATPDTTDWGVIGRPGNTVEGSYSDIIVIGSTRLLPDGSTCSGLDTATVKGYENLAAYWQDTEHSDVRQWGDMWQVEENQMPVLKCSCHSVAGEE